MTTALLTPSAVTAVRRSDELEARIARSPGDFRVLSGDRPTGALHLGHYVGTLRNRVRLQDQGIAVTVLVADYQVFTDRMNGPHLREMVRGLVLDYLAAGIDPSRSMIFAHSAVPALNQLMLPFLSLVSDAELHRNPTVRAETEATGRGPNALMLTYPVHQAADILFGKANLVPVGLDQLPHLEVARLIARRFRERYGVDVFPEPEALLTSAPLVPGLDGEKMSKSRGNVIPLGATADETVRLIRKAPTDSRRDITYDPVGRPQISALLDVFAAVTDRPATELADDIGTGGAGALKVALSDAVNELLAPLRARRGELADDPGYLEAVLRDGNAHAREIANRTLDEVHDAMGIADGHRCMDIAAMDIAAMGIATDCRSCFRG